MKMHLRSAVLAGVFLLYQAGGVGAEKCANVNGDVNGDGQKDISDVVYLVNSLYLGGPKPVTFCSSASQPKIAGFTSLGKNEQGYDEYRHDRTGIIFVKLPGGKFNMGSPDTEAGRSTIEGPVHEVTLSPFLIAKYEVTQAQWTAVMGSNPSHFTGDDSRPVEKVSWDDIQGFEAKTGLTLPTEAQWEYACRAGTAGPYAGTENLDDMGWYSDNSGSTTHPVGQKQPNQFGLYDMHGNAMEWCEDFLDADFYSNPNAGELDPECKEVHDMQVVRGGCWIFGVRDCRSAYRSGMTSWFRTDYLGFRPAMLLQEKFTLLDTNEQGYEEYRHNRTGIIFVKLPGGTFYMGAQSTDPAGQNYDPDAYHHESPVHLVTLSPFLIAKYEVTQAQWRAVMGSNPSLFLGDDNRPVEQVSWDDIQLFEGRTGLNLPTEAQWEYACRAGTSGPYAGTGNLNDMGWYSVSTTHPVGQKQPNQFGLYDMHGNVWELCEDDWVCEYSAREINTLDPVCILGSEYRVFRGGCWEDGAWNCRSAYRCGFVPVYRDGILGFRPAAPSP